MNKKLLLSFKLEMGNILSPEGTSVLVVGAETVSVDNAKGVLKFVGQDCVAIVQGSVVKSEGKPLTFTIDEIKSLSSI